jgi:hypothetical protein
LHHRHEAPSAADLDILLEVSLGVVAIDAGGPPRVLGRDQERCKEGVFLVQEL